MYPGKNVGIRLEGRWTPTYIKSDATGWWCDPYWGCYVTGDAQYSNQFELAAESHCGSRTEQPLGRQSGRTRLNGCGPPSPKGSRPRAAVRSSVLVTFT